MLHLRKSLVLIITILLIINLVLFVFREISILIFWLDIGVLYGIYLIGVRRTLKAK